MNTKKNRVKNVYYFLITIFCTHPIYSYASDLFSTTARDAALAEFIGLYNDWWLLFFGIFIIAWFFIQNEKLKELFKKAWIGTIAGYVILNNLSKVQAVADTISRWFTS